LDFAALLKIIDGYMMFWPVFVGIGFALLAHQRVEILKKSLSGRKS
jgi:hypothetical protein